MVHDPSSGGRLTQYLARRLRPITLAIGILLSASLPCTYYLLELARTQQTAAISAKEIAGQTILISFFFAITGSGLALLTYILPIRVVSDADEKLLKYQEELEELVRERTKELHIAVLQAEAAYRAKTDFLANTSHELRTPLNVVIGFSSILLDGLAGELSGQQRDHVQDILDSGRRLHTLVEGMLAVAQSEEGTLVLETSRFPLREALEAALLRFREVAQGRSISLRLDLAPAANVDIEADRDKLEQIVGNLVDNGIKFTPDGGGVLVRSRLDPESVEITVEDTGIGIPAKDLERLFEPFGQLEAPLTKTYDGAGLGLVLTKRLVELHGGRIKVESKPGAGSRFIVSLPLRKPGPAGDSRS